MNKPVADVSSGSKTPPDAGDDWQPAPAVGVSFAKSMSFENISYHVDNKTILDDISIDVEPGKVLCLLGPSGSGKTSLLRIAAGLIERCAGRVKIDEDEVTGPSVFVPPEKRGVGLVFQDYALFPHLTLQQNIEFGLGKLDKSESRQQASRVLSRVGMADRAHQYPHVLSGGEQQRVALARALAPRPGILLMDEPFSGLDSRLRDTVRDHSLELLRETRSTAIIVTHDAEEALRVGDKIALLKEGRLVQHGTGRELYHKPEDLFAAAFFSEINSFPVSVENGQAQTVFGSVKCDQFENGKADVAVRHTDVIVRPFTKSGSGRMGRILARRFLGTSELLELAIDGLDTTLQARIKLGELGGDESRVRVSVEPELMMIFPAGGN